MNGHRTAAVLVGALVGAHAVASMAENLWPGKNDQGAYLALGLAALRGAFPWDGTRGPLHSWLVAPVARPEEGYFVAAKALSATATVAAVASAAGLAGRWAGAAAGLACALALAAQGAVWANGTLATAEGLLCLLFIGATAAAARGRWRAAGGLLGLAYLAKTTALLGLPGLAWAAWRGGGHRAALGAAAAFFLCASPLLVHNAVTRGDPFYAWPSRHVLWMDRWGEHWDGPPPTWRTYVATHTPGDAVGRLARGLRDQARTDTGLLVAAALALAGLRTVRPLEARRAASFVLPTLAVFFVLFAWYPFRAHRFLLPLRPPVWALATVAVAHLPAAARRALGPAVAVGAAAGLVAVAPRLGPVGALHPDLRDLLAWREASSVPWSEIAYDVRDDFLPGDWLVPTPGVVPMADDPWGSNARCLLATRHAVFMRQAAFAPHVVPRIDGVHVGGAPASWRPVLARPSVAVLCRSR